MTSEQFSSFGQYIGEHDRVARFDGHPNSYPMDEISVSDGWINFSVTYEGYWREIVGYTRVMNGLWSQPQSVWKYVPPVTVDYRVALSDIPDGTTIWSQSTNSPSMIIAAIAIGGATGEGLGSHGGVVNDGRFINGQPGGTISSNLEWYFGSDRQITAIAVPDNQRRGRQVGAAAQRLTGRDYAGSTVYTTPIGLATPAGK